MYFEKYNKRKYKSNIFISKLKSFQKYIFTTQLQNYDALTIFFLLFETTLTFLISVYSNVSLSDH